MAGPGWRPRRRLDGRLQKWRTCTRGERRDEPNGTHPRAKRRPTVADDERAAAVVRLTGGDGAPTAGGEGGGATGLPHPLAKTKAATASDGDGGGGGAARMELGRRRRGLGGDGGEAAGHGMAREMGQTKEED
uniref:Uncharacterized protein K0098B12.41 n=1 Tax=Oryza sativa subsp. indica TaxID=39946 RepID=C8TF73_ORYSI|nr:hypothetical protein [Oryza sativa Indica Group]